MAQGLEEYPEAQGFGAKSARNWREFLLWGGLLSLLALLLCGLALGLAMIVTRFAAGWIVDSVPTEVDQEIGASVMEDLSLERCTDPATRAWLTAMAAIIREGQAGADPWELEFILVDDEIPNAFAVAGGPVIVNFGLLELAVQSEEIAGVLAHEVAHVRARHQLKSTIAGIGTFVGAAAIMGYYDVQALALGAAVVGVQAHSRNAEKEADEMAGARLLELGIDPRPFGQLFARLQAEEPHPAEGTLLASHPDPGGRAAHMKALVRADGPRRELPPLPSPLRCHPPEGDSADRTGDVVE